MKKIANWTLGSFFRTMGRFIFYLIIGTLIMYLLKDKLPSNVAILNVYANTVNPSYHDNNLDYISGLKFYNWTSSTEYSELNNTMWGEEYVENYNYNIYYNGNIKNFGSNGISFVPMISNLTLINNSYYSTTLYICYNNAVTINFKEAYISDLYANSFNYQSKYSKEILSNTIQSSSFGGNNPYNYCRAISFIYQPARDGNVLNIRLTSTGNLGDWYIAGTQTEFIGDAGNITQSQVQSAINNSGLASATSIAQVQSSINQVKEEVQGTKDLIESDSTNVESNSCGILCKLKNLLGIFKLDNLKYLIIPTEAQMQELLNDMQDKINSKLGLLGLPITIYTRLMNLAMTESEQNWCLNWEDVKVPNFEDNSIIEGGSFCFSDILQNEKINSFRNICITIIGSLILLSFVSYLYNAFRRVLDVPDRDEYIYITTNENENYLIDDNTGEAVQHWHNTRKSITRREKV